ncbi:MAG: hypothetical protein HKL80_11090 [Acidimicrobiales bacterium]|nr:hypothetical protein [Acidimicrobiales bacterium]
MAAELICADEYDALRQTVVLPFVPNSIEVHLMRILAFDCRELVAVEYLSGKIKNAESSVKDK